MTSTPDSIAVGVELQGLGDNTNTWGYTKLNNALTVLAKLASGYVSVAITGDTTVSDSNYSTTNTSENAVIEFTGSLSAAAAVTMPTRERRINFLNSATAAVTVKCSGGTGVSIPTGYMAELYCDGVDYYNAAPQLFDGALTVAGKISGLTAGTAATDAVNKTQMETAIAIAGLPATAGTVLNSSSDTTAGYLGSKITVSGALIKATVNGGANETLNLSTGPLPLATGAVISATGTIAAVNTRYPVNKATSYTITLPAAPSQTDVVWFDMYGAAGLTTFGLNSLKYYGGTTNPSTTGQGVQAFIYTDATTGWIDL